MQITDQLTIRRFVGGPMLTASYTLICPGIESVLIDAPRDAWRGGMQAAEDLGAPVGRLIATHGHWDHITDASLIRDIGIPLLAHPEDLELCANPMGQRAGLPVIIQPVPIDEYLSDGQRLDFAGQELQILHTPGHSRGSICIWLPDNDILFTGDTILKGGAGYLERPESDATSLATSVLRIAALPERTILFPGHGGPTRLGDERWLMDVTGPEELVALWQSGSDRWPPRS